MGAELNMFIKSGPTKLNSLCYLKWLQVDFQVMLSQNKQTVFTHSLVITSINTQNCLVVNFGVETT